MIKSVFASLVLMLLLGGVTTVFAQGKVADEDIVVLQTKEDSLLVMADSMYNAPIMDTRRYYCEQFVKMLVRALKTPNSYTYPFKKLNDVINIMSPDDNAFRIFNWSIVPAEMTQYYFGAIQMPGEQLKLYPLFDYNEKLGAAAEDSVLTGGKWYGALYYAILPHKADGETVYTMLGLNTSGASSKKKVADALTITSDGVVFGAPIFNIRSKNRPTERINRFILEYNKDVQVSMNWQEDQKAIVFDKLVSQINDPNRKYTYVPSGEYDGFRWDGGHWNFVTDLIPTLNLKDGEAPSGKQ